MEEEEPAMGALLFPCCIQVLTSKMLLTTGVLCGRRIPLPRLGAGRFLSGKLVRPLLNSLSGARAAPGLPTGPGGHVWGLTPRSVVFGICFGDLFRSWRSWAFHYKNRVRGNSQLRVNTRLGGVKRMLYRWSIKHSGLLFNFHGFGNDI